MPPPPPNHRRARHVRSHPKCDVQHWVGGCTPRMWLATKQSTPPVYAPWSLHVGASPALALTQPYRTLLDMASTPSLPLKLPPRPPSRTHQHRYTNTHTWPSMGIPSTCAGGLPTICQPQGASKSGMVQRWTDSAGAPCSAAAQKQCMGCNLCEPSCHTAATCLPACLLTGMPPQCRDAPLTPSAQGLQPMNPQLPSWHPPHVLGQPHSWLTPGRLAHLRPKPSRHSRGSSTRACSKQARRVCRFLCSRRLPLTPNTQTPYPK